MIRRRKASLLFAIFALLAWGVPPAGALDLFARHQVTAQFATAQGKPMADAEVQVYAPGQPGKPAITGRTDAQGNFVFDADRDGFWTAEARQPGKEIARIVIRVGEQPGARHGLSPWLALAALALLLILAIWYRALRARARRPPP